MALQSQVMEQTQSAQELLKCVTAIGVPGSATTILEKCEQHIKQAASDQNTLAKSLGMRPTSELRPTSKLGSSAIKPRYSPRHWLTPDPPPAQECQGPA